MISKCSYVPLCKAYQAVIDALDEVIAEEKQCFKRTDVINQEDDKSQRNTSPLRTLRRDFEKWLKQMPTLGFNSPRYDLTLLEKYLIPSLFDTYPKLSAIKKRQQFLIDCHA